MVARAATTPTRARPGTPTSGSGIPGPDKFAGTVFHSAHWNHDHDLTGRQVAVIGTGASAIQFVPHVQQKAASVSCSSARAVSDPGLREKLTPRYSIGCKRILISNDYYPALASANVQVVADGIEAIEASGIRTADGVSLEKAWADSGMRAHLGTTVPGFPNLFLLLGPNTGIGYTSAVSMIESQIGLVRHALEHTERPQHRAVAGPHLPVPPADPPLPSERLHGGCPRRHRLLG